MSTEDDEETLESVVAAMMADPAQTQHLSKLSEFKAWIARRFPGQEKRSDLAILFHDVLRRIRR